MLQPFSESRGITLLTFFVLLMATPVSGTAFQGGVEISSGYDDNVTKTNHAKEGSGFINGRFQFQQELFQDVTDLSITLGIDGYHKEYFSMAEQQQAGGLPKSTAVFSTTDFIRAFGCPGSFIEMTIYRQTILTGLRQMFMQIFW